MSRSKRLVGVANAAPHARRHRIGDLSSPQSELIQPRVLLLLLPDVLADQRLVPAHGGDKVSAGPQVLSHEVALALPVHPRQMKRALAIDEPDHLRDRVLRRDRDHHVHMIGHQMSFLDSALFLRGPLLEHLSEVSTQLPIQSPSAPLGD